ncbi:hypothetical protein PybrP1_007567 [[Pythium] brassicae (nom. inval.)]|nr:hypothetical protein PybrP1_007567 [[Pythium] brassicae (nom. inval.)]
MDAAHSSSRDGSSAVVAPSKSWTADARDSCTWYAGMPCDRPRSCFDCLNVRLPGSECVVDPGGACIASDTYEAVRGAYPSTYVFFPAAEFAYCHAGDAACASCRAGWGNGSLPTSTSSCVGADGCVCIARCELSSREASVLERARCASSAGTENSVLKLLMALGIALSMCAVFTAIAFAVRNSVRFFEARARLERLRQRRLPRRTSSGLPLALDGWKAMREELMEKEREHLAGGGAESVVEPTEVVVEQGNGYRPLSPSQMHR